MNTITRINNLLEVTTVIIPKTVKPGESLHPILNALDSAIGADTEWLSSLECSCLWHIGKTCHNRRAVGARVRILEETVALNDLKQQFSV